VKSKGVCVLCLAFIVPFGSFSHCCSSQTCQAKERKAPARKCFLSKKVRDELRAVGIRGMHAGRSAWLTRMHSHRHLLAYPGEMQAQGEEQAEAAAPAEGELHAGAISRRMETLSMRCPAPQS
jgi:hypothetical protein